MPEHDFHPLTRDRILALLDVLRQFGGDFIRFGELGEAVRSASPDEVAGMGIPIPAADMLRLADDLERLRMIWSAAGGQLIPGGGGPAAAHALFQRMAGAPRGGDLFGSVTLEEMQAVESLAPQVDDALQVWRTAAFAEIEAGYEADKESLTRITDADPEALQWLRENGQEAPLASNRFDTEDAIAFVEELYAAGAERVAVAREGIRDDEYELSLGGPYADTLKVRLPGDAEKRRALFAIAAREAEDEGYDVEPDTGQDVLVFWWD